MRAESASKDNGKNSECVAGTSKSITYMFHSSVFACVAITVKHKHFVSHFLSFFFFFSFSFRKFVFMSFSFLLFVFNATTLFYCISHLKGHNYHHHFDSMEELILHSFCHFQFHFNI